MPISRACTDASGSIQLGWLYSVPGLSTKEDDNGEPYLAVGSLGDAWVLTTRERAEEIATANGWAWYAAPSSAGIDDLVKTPNGPDADDFADVPVTGLHVTTPLAVDTIVMLIEYASGVYAAVPVESWDEMREYDGFTGVDAKALISTPGAQADGTPLWERGDCP